MKAAKNGNTHKANGAPARIDAAEVLDKWAAIVFDAGSYSAAEHAELAELVLSRRIPIMGELCDGRIVWYDGAPKSQAE